MAAFADPIPTQGCQLPDRAPGEWVMAMIRPPLPIKGAANWAPNKKAVACELMACCHCSTRISMGGLELGNFWPGVIDEDIEFPEFTLHMIHHSPNVIGPVYIRLNNEPVRAALPYFCERVIRGVNVLIVVNANLRAAFCQLQCYGPANPPRRSRDQGVLALQRHTVWPSFMRKSTSPDPAGRRKK